MMRDDKMVDFQKRIARQGGVGGAQMKVTARNLRIMEDIPKYLRNLDPNSAYYDPKSRAMRENPLPHLKPEEAPFAGDNFLRASGDTLKLAKTQVYCWEAEKRGTAIDPIANPSQAELAVRQFEHRKAELETEKKRRILDKYGATEQPQERATAAKLMDPRLRLGQTEAFVKYTHDGRMARAPDAPRPTSKYEEDVYPGNHASVWGSFFDRRRFKWGYACCHSVVRGSYCTGEAGKAANDAAGLGVLHEEATRKMLEAKTPAERKGEEEERKRREMTTRADVFGESEATPQLDEERLREAVEREKDFQRRAVGGERGSAEDRKRRYNSMEEVEMTKEGMEAYRLTRRRAEDPMADMLGSETLLEYNDGKSGKRT
mmetsp:Transcript_17315/g.58791  ORF Transcript_17315/g.58791 Transcript_17315/m.58791 type:complete len:374 (-) Transcript_17315:58-1179(-)